MTRSEIERGDGLLTGGRWTLIWQRGTEDVYDTSDADARQRPGWHLAGGARLPKQGRPSIQWCDVRS